MKINFKNLIRKKVKLAATVSGVDESINPLHAWVLGLGTAVFVFLLGVAFIAFDFYTQFYLLNEDISVGEQPVVYRENEVRSFAEQYEEKERIFNSLRLQRPALVPQIEATTTSETTMEQLDETLAEEAIDE